MKPIHIVRINLLASIIFFVTACSVDPATKQAESAIPQKNAENADDLYVVDCLLPGRIRKLGQSFTYLTPRRPAKTTAIDCEIRGGEYVAYDRASYATALKIWLPKAQNGDPQAQTYVGEIYEKGLGVQPDYPLASQWYRKAADQGYSRAQINLGYLHEKGLVGDRDMVTALNWYRKASGLEGDDLAFASTIETAVREEYENRISLLENELTRSQNEIKIQRKTLKQSQNMLDLGRKRLNRAKQQLEKARTQLQTAKASSNNNTPQQQNVAIYEQDLKRKEATLSNSYQEVQKLEAALTKQNTEFNVQLKKAEQRTIQLNQEIARHQKENVLLQDRLAITQSQLIKTEDTLAKLNRDYKAGKETILAQRKDLEETRSKLEVVKTSSNSELKQQNLQKYEDDLKLKEAKLAETNQAVQKLELELKKQTTDFNAKLNESKQLTTQLNEQVAYHQEENLKLQKRLAENQSKLEKTENDLVQLNSNYQQEKENILADKRELEQLKQSEVAEKQQSLSKLENDLALREKQQNEHRQQIIQLEKEKSQYEKELTELETIQRSKATYAKPSIEIIEPPFVVTRGVPTIRLRSPMRQRQIVGKVTAPAGLLSFNVNDLQTDVNEVGIFKSLIQLKKIETPVKTVAVDKIGNMAEFEFLLLSSKSKNNQQPSPPSKQIPEIDFGSNHALIIGNQSYPNLPSLETPINDANAIDRILRENYSFKTTVLIDADRYTILSSLNKLREQLTEKDNLLVYYAGHGELDRVNLRGHWLPTDAEPDNSANWISTVAITDVLNTMNAMHILVIADSCYSGAMTRTSLARLEPGMSNQLKTKWLKIMAATRSRTVLTSGSLEPVLDTGMNGHSVFANALIDALSKNEGILEGQTLYRIVSEKVKKATLNLDFKQEPQYAPIRFGGHESGDFFLVRREQTVSKKLEYIADTPVALRISAGI